MKAKIILKTVGRFIKVKRSTLMMGAAFITGLLTTYFVASETPQAMEAVAEKKEEQEYNGENVDGFKCKMARVGTGALSYKKSIISGLVTIALGAGSHVDMSSRLRESDRAYDRLATAYERQRKAINSLPEKTRKEIADQEADIYRKEVIEKKSASMEGGKIAEFEDTGTGNVLFIFKWNGRGFYSSWMNIVDGLERFNEYHRDTGDFGDINELWDYIGLSSQPCGDRGWWLDRDGEVEIEPIWSGATETGNAICFLEFRVDPRSYRTERYGG